MAVWAGVEVALDRLARFEETRRNHYLWWQEEWLQTLQRSDFAGRGSRMLFLGGASEAREGFLYEMFGEAFPGLIAYQGAQSGSTMESFLLQIDYMDRVYGAEAFPRYILLGVTPRYVLNSPPVDHAPFFEAINPYSPYYNVEVIDEHYRLYPKSRIESAKARYRFIMKQTRRYRNAIRGLVHDVAARFAPSIAAKGVLTIQLSPYKYHHLPPRPTAQHYEFFRSIAPASFTIDGPDGQYARVQVTRLQQILRRHGSEVYVVTMPEPPWMKPYYPEPLATGYVDFVRSLYGADRVLDLSTLLPETMFYDRTHPTREGGRLISAAIIEWLRPLSSFAGP